MDKNLNLSDEEKRIAEELGVVQKIPDGRQAPVFKGRKVSSFHIEIIKSNIDKILSGELNTREVWELVNEEAVKLNETQIKDKGSIKRTVTKILSDKPEELKKYNESLKNNIGKRYPYKGKRNLKNDGTTYQQKKLEFEKEIIQDYLPQILSGEITFEMIEKELHTSHQTFDAIIKKYYLESKDIDGLKTYEEAKKRNYGVSIEARKNAKSMREEVGNYEVVSNSEFLLLPEEEQDKQIVMKIRKTKLQEEKNSEKFKTAVITEDTTINAIQKIKEYFRSKNDFEKGIENFSEQDIRHIIFAYPTVISRSSQNLDEKLKVLTSYDEIDEKTAYGMVKSFPAIIGYDAKRTKTQLDLLKEENLIDYAIKKPSGLMRSAGLMYALIQFAKERHGTSDLTEVNKSNIFMGNSTLKRLYGVTCEEIKERFPYEISKEEQDISYSVTGEDIGKATYDSVSVEKSDKAFEIVQQLVTEKEQTKGVK